MMIGPPPEKIKSGKLSEDNIEYNLFNAFNFSNNYTLKRENTLDKLKIIDNKSNLDLQSQVNRSLEMFTQKHNSKNYNFFNLLESSKIDLF